MYVIPEFKFCFLAAPRTGSKAIAQALVEHRNAIKLGSHHDTPDDHLNYHVTQEWVVCSTVRNHWDAMVSWWFKIEKRGTMMPFDEFLPRFCAANTNFVYEGQLWWKHAPYINTLLRHENLQADFDQALVKAGMAPLDLPTVTDSKRNSQPYQIFYKKGRVVDWVREYFKDEIAKYRYKF